MKIDSQPLPRRLLTALLIIIAAAILLLILPSFYRCPFYAVTGIPCPGCGVTRGAYHLLHLDFARAWKANPCVYLVAIYAAGFFFCLLWGRTYLFHKKQIWIFFATVFILIYALRMALYFPDIPPMSFDSSALIPRIFAAFSG